MFLYIFFNKLRYDKKLHKKEEWRKIDSIEETQKEKANWAVLRRSRVFVEKEE